MFSKKATKITKSSLSIWRLLSKCQIDDEDFVIFCGLLRKHEIYSQMFLFCLNRLCIKSYHLQYELLYAHILIEGFRNSFFKKRIHGFFAKNILIENEWFMNQSTVHHSLKQKQKLISSWMAWMSKPSADEVLVGSF